MKGDSSLLEADETWLAGDRELMHDVLTMTSTPKRGGVVVDVYDADDSATVMKTIEPTSIPLGSEQTDTFNTTDTYEDTISRRVAESTAEYDASQAREELSESIHSVRTRHFTLIHLPMS